MSWNNTWPQKTNEQLRRDQTRMEQELQMAQIELQIARARVSKPFDQTEDFRDFIVWLCGFTERNTSPDQQDWDKLCGQVKQVAAKFALRAHDQAKIPTYYQPDLFAGQSSIAITSSDVLSENAYNALVSETKVNFANSQLIA